MSKRQKKREKCKKVAIMAMALAQHEHMPGHPDNWECKVNEHTWCVACSFAPAMVHVYASCWYLAYSVLCHLTDNILLCVRSAKRFRKKCEKSVSEMSWDQSNLKSHQCMVITKSYQEGYRWGDRQHVMLNYLMPNRYPFTKREIIPSFRWEGWSRSNTLCSHFVIWRSWKQILLVDTHYFYDLHKKHLIFLYEFHHNYMEIHT